ncbi:hypothetical protein GCM10009850_000840 [Nonomuraea monospora]|uniref:Uncharacterized protein n=1 Tax=Nonomuraea monospora TaxID=568818 RepID=A0ABN3C4L4_9ACTN
MYEGAGSDGYVGAGSDGYEGAAAVTGPRGRGGGSGTPLKVRRAKATAAPAHRPEGYAGTSSYPEADKSCHAMKCMAGSIPAQVFPPC